MKAIKLTPKQKELFERLTSMTGAVLFKHVKPSGTICYRVLDEKKNPVMNVRCGLVDELISKDLLDRNGNEYILKATIGEEEMNIANLGFSKSVA